MTQAPITDNLSKTQVFLLAGFLGSGKTTLLNRVLSWETDLSETVVLVNEFGKIGIDGSLIKSKNNDVIEMTSGCICCSIKTKLIDTLIDIWTRYKPKIILLEATGVAEPNSVADVFNDDFLRDRMELSKIVTVLDIRYWNGRDKFGPFFMNQVQQADLVLLNKVDLVPKDRVRAALSEMHAEIANCHVIPSLHGEVDPEVFWSIKGNQYLGNFYTLMPISDVSSKKVNAQIAYDTFDFVSEVPLNETCFETFLKNLPWQLFRIKGPVRFSSQTLMLNFAAGQINWQKWEDAGGTRLAFIGWDIDPEKILQALHECLIHQKS